MLDNTLPVLPIVRPTFPPLEAISERFAECLRTGQVTNGGRYVEEFEAALTEYLGVPTICFSSGMAALVAMLMAEGVSGRDVICPSLTFCATPHAIKIAGGNPVFADIDPATLTLDPVDVHRKLTSKTKAIVGVDVYGILCDYQVLASIGIEHDIRVMFDSAPAFGSLWQGRPTASPMDCPQIFSFHATKPFSVGGEGGAFCGTNEFVIAEAKKIRNFGQPAFPEIYPTIGFNGKMQEINALVGLEALKVLPSYLTNRRFAASCLVEQLRYVPGVGCMKSPLGQSPSWCYYPIRIDEQSFGMSRDAVVTKLATRGIIVRKYYEACHLSDVYAEQRTSLPVTEKVASQVIALPIYNNMTIAECERVTGAIRDIQATT